MQGAGAAPQQAQQPAAPPEPEPPLQVPEPRADQIATLTDMGFSEAVARKALLLTRCNVELALEWVLQHMDEPDAETPPTQEQLRQVGWATCMCVSGWLDPPRCRCWRGAHSRPSILVGRLRIVMLTWLCELLRCGVQPAAVTS